MGTQTALMHHRFQRLLSAEGDLWPGLQLSIITTSFLSPHTALPAMEAAFQVLEAEGTLNERVSHFFR
jgi:hypothetical protein